MKACKQACKTHLSRSNSKHGRQSFCRCVQQESHADPEFVCAWGQQTSAYLPLHVNLCCRMRMRLCQWNLDIRSWSILMRSEQPLKKSQSSCCEPDFTEEGESAENRGEVLKPLITDISTAVSTALSEFNDKDRQKTLDPQ